LGTYIVNAELLPL